MSGHTCPSCGRPLPSEALSRLTEVPLSPSQRVIATMLAGRVGEWVATHTIIDRLYGDRPDGGPESPALVIAVRVSTMRARLAAAGLALECQTGGRGGGSWRRMVMEGR